MIIFIPFPLKSDYEHVFWWVFAIREGICECGYPKTKHHDDAIKPEDYIGQQYDKLRHMREFPTDAFGDISFGGLGSKTGKVNWREMFFSVMVCLSAPLCTVETLECDL